MKKEIILLGAPASGKGTQTKKIAKELNLPHIDTGSMLRAEMASGSEEGQIAKGFIEKGQLVPVEIVARIIKNRLSKEDCEKGFILDGYPRSIEQAEILDGIFNEINKDKEFKIIVINVDVDETVLIERIVNRRLCKECGNIYNLKFCPPKNSDICDGCGATLYQRSDDSEEIAVSRLNTYNEQTQPLINYYTNKGLLVNINGNRSVDEIYGDIQSIVV